MAGEIECVARLCRKGRRWIIRIDMPDWVEQEVCEDIANVRRGIIIETTKGAARLTIAPPPEEPERMVQVLPEGLGTAGIPVPGPPARPAARKTEQEMAGPYAAGIQYIRDCHAKKKPIEPERLETLTGLGAGDCERLIIRVLSEAIDAKYLVCPASAATAAAKRTPIPAVATKPDPALLSKHGSAAETVGMKTRGVPRGYRQSPETIEKRKQTIAANRAAKKQMDASGV